MYHPPLRFAITSLCCAAVFSVDGTRIEHYAERNAQLILPDKHAARNVTSNSTQNYQSNEIDNSKSYTHEVQYLLAASFLGCLLVVCIQVRSRSNQREDCTTEVPSEFLAFLRPLPNRDGNGIVWNQAPPKPRMKFQMTYDLSSQKSMYGALVSHSGTVVHRVGFHCLGVMMFTVVMWCVLFLRDDVDFRWIKKGGSGWLDMWLESIKSAGQVHTVIQVCVTFALYDFVRKRITWFDVVMSLVWDVRSTITQASEWISLSMPEKGVDPSSDRQIRLLKHDVYRWLTTAHFLQHQVLNVRYSATTLDQLAQLGLLMEDEVAQLSALASAELSALASAGSETENLCSTETYDTKGSAMMGMLRQLQRDICLKWVESAIVLAFEKKWIPNDKKEEKCLSAVVEVHTKMMRLTSEASRRMLYSYALLMEVFVDAFVVLNPLRSLALQYQPHIAFLFWPVLRAGVVALFYYGMFEISRIVQNPFGMDLDDLNVDPVLLGTERMAFSQLAGVVPPTCLAKCSGEPK
jgi:hypothetical protein